MSRKDRMGTCNLTGEATSPPWSRQEPTSFGECFHTIKNMTASRYGPWLAQWTEEIWSEHSLQLALRTVSFIETAPPLAPLRSLDLGCGTGRALEVFLQAGWDAEGLDESPDMLALAGERLRRYPGTKPRRLHAGRMQAGLPRGPYGLITAFYNILNHLGSMEEIRRLALEIRRSLAPGGWFLGDLNTCRGFASWHEREIGPVQGLALEVWRHYDPTSGRALLRVSGHRGEESFEEVIVNQAHETRAVADAFRRAGFGRVGFAPPDSPATDLLEPESLDRVLLKAQV